MMIHKEELTAKTPIWTRTRRWRQRRTFYAPLDHRTGLLWLLKILKIRVFNLSLHPRRRCLRCSFGRFPSISSRETWICPWSNDQSAGGQLGGRCTCAELRALQHIRSWGPEERPFASFRLFQIFRSPELPTFRPCRFAQIFSQIYAQFKVVQTHYIECYNYANL